jgi:signal transduction histidine kinase
VRSLSILAVAMQEGTLTGGNVRTEAPARPRRARGAVLPRAGLAYRLGWGILPAALAIAVIWTVDHFVAHVGATSAPLLLSVVLGSFLGGSRAGMLAAAMCALFLAIHDDVGGWPPMWTNEGASRILLFIPSGLAAAFLVGLLQRRALQRYVREREHGERMATLERVKSQFLNVASHELRGPLGVVSGYVSLVRDGSFGELSGVDMRRVAPVLEQKVAEMNTLVNEMLDTARLEESRLTLQLGTVDLGDLMQRAVDAVSPLASKKHEILYSRPRQPVTVVADQVRAAIIVTNLLQNAVKYSPRGGVVQCFVTDDDGIGLVSVWDQGLGIAPEDLPRLFSRFGRLVTRENSHIPGTGLGLYLARELARLHGGDITVRSAAGAGSCFTLTLPVAGPEEPIPIS